MSNFFEQLLARHQGQAETVQPLIPARFAAAPPLPLPPEQPTWANPAPTPAPPFPTLPHPQPPIGESIATAPPTLPLSHPSPLPPSHLSPSQRIETVTHWIHQVEQEQSLPSDSPQNFAEQLQSTPRQPPFLLPQNSPVSSPARAADHSLAIPVTEIHSAASVSPVSDSSASPSKPIQPDSELAKPSLEPILRPINPAPEAVAPVPIQPVLNSLPVPVPQSPLRQPSVRVSIGRVEVRAISAPPATPPSPRRAAPQRRSPLSLDAYLQQRSRRP